MLDCSCDCSIACCNPQEINCHSHFCTLESQLFQNALNEELCKVGSQEVRNISLTCEVLVCILHSLINLVVPNWVRTHQGAIICI